MNYGATPTRCSRHCDKAHTLSGNGKTIFRRCSHTTFWTSLSSAITIQIRQNEFPALLPHHLLDVAAERYHHPNPTKHMFHRTVDGNKFATSDGQIILSCFRKCSSPRLSANPVPPISMLHLGLASFRTCNHCFHRRRTMYTPTLKLGGWGIWSSIFALQISFRNS